MSRRKKSPIGKIIIILIIIVLAILVTDKVKNNKTAKTNTNSENVEEVIENVTTNEENVENIENKVEKQEESLEEKRNKQIEKMGKASSLPVLMYHFFYDKNETKGQDNNWMEISDFEEQIKYLTDKEFYYPTWEEVEDFIDEKINLPNKSVVITVDDGDDSFFELAVPVLQKYNAKATSFVITSWYGYRANEKQQGISYQSHSDSMHEGAGNGKGVMLSWSYDKMTQDVKKSSTILGGATVFCYPFGQYNDLDKKVLKDAGYKLAFTTEGGRVYKNSDKFALPRVRMSRGVSLSSFASMVN